MIPIIDIFAGPGGLGEGFSSLRDEDNNRFFNIKLSIEKDEHAHTTLKLRSFYRQFSENNVPEDYYRFIRGEITLTELYNLHPAQAALASDEAWCATLGEPDETDLNGASNDEIDERIRVALNGNINWVLIGGPPCQAYSLVGRSRRQEVTLDEEKDKRVGLYKEYLRILAVHTPTVFVMENVKGILSAKTKDQQVFKKILEDLADPVSACISEGAIFPEDKELTKYKIYSLTTEAVNFDASGNPIFSPKDFIIKSEDYGVPQKRHRVILLGVRADIEFADLVLEKKDSVNLRSVIEGLPTVRSGVTRFFTRSEMITNKDGIPVKKRFYKKETDSTDIWTSYIREFDTELNHILTPQSGLSNHILPESLGEEYIAHPKASVQKDHPLVSWYGDKRLEGVLHHVSRKHLAQDLKRYLFAARYVKEKGVFPRLEDYKKAAVDLMPDHENVESGKFTDRFRVQLPDIPATTVTSHISKDGHYFIHYDPTQCRSLTVREAARIQTFPDNYYFCGGRTQQFHQVGNAVPPYLAYQIATIVSRIFEKNEINQ